MDAVCTAVLTGSFQLHLQRNTSPMMPPLLKGIQMFGERSSLNIGALSRLRYITKSESPGVILHSAKFLMHTSFGKA